MIEASNLGDGTVEKCPSCGWTGRLDQCAMPWPDFFICPQCYGLGSRVVTETVPLSKLPPVEASPPFDLDIDYDGNV